MQILMLFIIGLFLIQGDFASAAEKTMKLNEFLEWYGGMTGTFFTVEELDNGDISNEFIPVKIEVNQLTSSSKFDLSYISRKLPAYYVIHSSAKSSIYNVINRRLVGVAGYSLNKTIKNFTYRGSIFELPEAVSQISSSLYSHPQQMGGRFPVIDNTLISISVSNGVVRDILVEAVDVKRYPNVAWVARTSIKDDWKTTLQFSSPNR